MTRILLAVGIATFAVGLALAVMAAAAGADFFGTRIDEEAIVVVSSPGSAVLEPGTYKLWFEFQEGRPEPETVVAAIEEMQLRVTDPQGSRVALRSADPGDNFGLFVARGTAEFASADTYEFASARELELYLTEPFDSEGPFLRFVARAFGSVVAIGAGIVVSAVGWSGSRTRRPVVSDGPVPSGGSPSGGGEPDPAVPVLQPPPPSGGAGLPTTAVRSDPRRHDLDGLRAVAMFLGVVLHAALPFVPYWGDGDVGGQFLWGLFEFIHIWRMPLFFLISGYFTTMLWRRRGLRSLVRHRLRRIGLPLLIAMFTILPLLIAGAVAGYALSGDLDQQAIDAGGADEYREPGADATDQIDGKEEGGLFAHLWFLWHLLWLVAGFALVALTLDAIRHLLGREPPGAVGEAIGWLLVPLSLPIYLTFASHLGPDTSDGLVPATNVLGYYACFFGFGALLYRTPQEDRVEPIDRLGVRWKPLLVVSTALFFPAFFDAVPPVATDVIGATLAWTISFGAIGLFRAKAAAPSFRARWFSDGAYWMYLIHLPLIFVFQGVAAALALPAIPAFVFVVAAVSALLALSYRYLVRYSPVGTLLNGRRTRQGDALLRERLTKDQASTEPAEPVDHAPAE